jgi:hypothetical protein
MAKVTAGYSGTPLAKKLGMKPGGAVLVVNAPDDYEALLEPAPEGLRFVKSVSASVDIVHLFVGQRADLERRLAGLRNRIAPHAAVWVSWPKKSSGVATDITEDTIRAVCLPLGFVDVKVCAVDETWSGLKLVIRKALR